MIDDLLERVEKLIKKRLKARRKNRPSASGYSGRHGYGVGNGRGRGRDNIRVREKMVGSVLARLTGGRRRRDHGIYGAFSGGGGLDRRWRNDHLSGYERSKRRRKQFDLD